MKRIRKKFAVRWNAYRDTWCLPSIKYDDCYVVWGYDKRISFHWFVKDVFYTKKSADDMKRYMKKCKIIKVKELEKWYTKLMMNDTM